MIALRRCATAGLCLVVLACARGSVSSHSHEYTLIGDGARLAAAGDQTRQGIHGDVTLRLVQASAAPWLAREGIYYRLRYHDADRLAPYAEARWLAPAPQMLQSLLAEALDRGGAWKAVIGPGDDAVADVTLSLQLLELVQEFTSPSQSFGVLRARATLTDARTRGVIAQRVFDYRIEAPSPDAAGGVQAEREASGRMAQDVAAWAAGQQIPRGHEATPGTVSNGSSGAGAPAGNDGHRD